VIDPQNTVPAKRGLETLISSAKTSLKLWRQAAEFRDNADRPLLAEAVWKLP
jgi:hypothetical protein